MLDSPEIHHVRPLALGGCYTCLELGQQCRDHLEEKRVNMEEESYIHFKQSFPLFQHEYSELNICLGKVKSKGGYFTGPEVIFASLLRKDDVSLVCLNYIQVQLKLNLKHHFLFSPSQNSVCNITLM